jgi:hypothetical protein
MNALKHRNQKNLNGKKIMDYCTKKFLEHSRPMVCEQGHSISSWSRIFFEKVVTAQLVNKLSRFYGRPWVLWENPGSGQITLKCALQN